MSTPLDNFAARLTTRLHQTLDAMPVDDLPWVDAHPKVAERARRRRRSRIKASVTVLAAAATVTAVIVVAQPGSRRSVTPAKPHTLKVLATASVGGSTPSSLAAGSGWVFAGLWDSGQLLRLDPTTLHTTATLQVGTARNGPLSVAFGDGAVWVLNFADTGLWRVEPSTMAATLKVTLPGQPSQVAVGDGAVWVTVCCTSTDTSTRQRLLRIDPATGAITGSQQVAGDGETVSLAVGPDVVVTSQNGPILVIDPNTMKVVRTLPDPCAGCNQAAGVVAGQQGIYLTSFSSVVRYDPKSGRLLIASPDINDIEAPLSAQPDGIWLSATSRVLRLDPVSLTITAEAPIAAGAYLIELTGSIYISSYGTIDKLGPTS